MGYTHTRTRTHAHAHAHTHTRTHTHLNILVLGNVLTIHLLDYSVRERENQRLLNKRTGLREIDSVLSSDEGTDLTRKKRGRGRGGATLMDSYICRIRSGLA